MQSSWTISRLQLDPGQWATDYLRGYAVFASLDNSTWGTPIRPLTTVRTTRSNQSFFSFFSDFISPKIEGSCGRE